MTQKYQSRKHRVIPKRDFDVDVGFVIPEFVQVKSYILQAEDGEELEKYSGLVTDSVSELLRRRAIPITMGLGFSILSEGVLNLCGWGGEEFPSTLHQAVYTFNQKPSLEDLQKQDLEKAGSICAYEGEIIGHESRLFRRFLNSSQDGNARVAYLENFFQGDVDDSEIDKLAREKQQLERRCEELNRHCLDLVRDLEKR